LLANKQHLINGSNHIVDGDVFSGLQSCHETSLFPF